MTVSAHKKILPILILLFVLSGINAAYAEDGVSKYILGLDVGKDSWGYEVGGRFGQRYASFGVSIRDIGDEWPWGYNRFDHAPLTTWKLTGKYNTNESEVFLKYGVFLTSSIGVEAGLGHARQDIVEVYNDPNTGLTWQRAVRGDRGLFTAMAGARYLVSKGYYLRVNYHTSRGIIVGIGVMF